MKKKLSRITLDRETLRMLDSPTLRHAVGGATMVTVAEGCNTTCNCTVTCATNCAGATCLPCTNGC